MFQVNEQTYVLHFVAMPKLLKDVAASEENESSVKCLCNDHQSFYIEMS